MEGISGLKSSGNRLYDFHETSASLIQSFLILLHEKTSYHKKQNWTVCTKYGIVLAKQLTGN